ncbi:MAG: bifunctional diaminohydroxyphosphoribosylaminopyrimidine deaminase/5-amino-6-(5-phosphoribosylamino)uracil reductase RibD [Bacteroidia bacterium]|nr:bifunctional diaminohydroxyphosphoribosylaminopyrimidine deaminase/5-amino-6-(5-phosphoribosylamino)uracil reductase RibD [Bacteroidia bacterium]
MTNTHEVYMRRCLELARLGAGTVSPNPMVGAVIVYNGRIIGEGWHQQYGQAHAEVHAVNSVKDTSVLTDADLYVSLEPCSHTGKTPPCANLIIQHKFKRVIIGMSDPNPLVAGKGIALLKEAGIEVVTDILKDECWDLNRRFIKQMLHKRPYIILKWAQTRNGFIAPLAAKMSPQQFEEERHITGFMVQRLVHKWRTQEDAIMVATNTVITDNPALDARAWKGRAPKRIVLDRTLKLNQQLKVFKGPQQTFVINEIKEGIEENITYIKSDFNGNWIDEMFKKLLEFNIQSIVVEGGSVWLHSLLEQNYWDEAIVFYSPKHISEGVPAPAIGGKLASQFELDNMQASQYLNI